MAAMAMDKNIIFLRPYLRIGCGVHFANPEPQNLLRWQEDDKMTISPIGQEPWQEHPKEDANAINALTQVNQQLKRKHLQKWMSTAMVMTKILMII